MRVRSPKQAKERRHKARGRTKVEKLDAYVDGGKGSTPGPADQLRQTAKALTLYRKEGPQVAEKQRRNRETPWITRTKKKKAHREQAMRKGKEPEDKNRDEEEQTDQENDV